MFIGGLETNTLRVRQVVTNPLLKLLSQHFPQRRQQPFVLLPPPYRHPEKPLGQPDEIPAVADQNPPGEEPRPKFGGGGAAGQFHEKKVGGGRVGEQAGDRPHAAREEGPLPGDQPEGLFAVTLIGQGRHAGGLGEVPDAPRRHQSGQPSDHPGCRDGIAQPEPRQGVELGKRAEDHPPPVIHHEGEGRFLLAEVHERLVDDRHRARLAAEFQQTGDLDEGDEGPGGVAGVCQDQEVVAAGKPIFQIPEGEGEPVRRLQQEVVDIPPGLSQGRGILGEGGGDDERPAAGEKAGEEMDEFRRTVGGADLPRQ